MIFDGDKCLLFSMQDVSQRHMLEKQQKEIDLLKKLHATITENLVDPLSLIAVSSNWLIRWYKKT